jgi:hypothetical protein
MLTDFSLPPLPLGEWIETKKTLHLYSQIIGKIKLKLYPYKNHWWSAALYVNASGIGTSPLPYKDKLVEFNFDFCKHQLVISTTNSERAIIELKDGLCVAEFYKQVFAALEKMNIEVEILAKPYEFETDTPFAADTAHCTYDKDAVHKFWQVLFFSDAVFKEFSGKFLGKCSPVHMFWHSFDLAVTRFSGERGPEMPGANKVNAEAYSHKVISAGFWAGDKNIQEPAYYSYTYPSPDGLDAEPILPEGKAKWVQQNGSPMAIFTYEDMRTSDDPKAALLDFLQSTYEAGAKTSRWPVEDFEARVK